jgi:hypothetical protein
MGKTTTTHCAVFKPPSVDAVIIAEPPATALTVPFRETVATVSLSELQVTVSISVLPVLNAALSVSVSSTSKLRAYLLSLMPFIRERHFAYRAVLPITLLEKSYSAVKPVSLYQPVNIYPFLTGSGGREAATP